jgi:hypothetical protein
MIIVPGTFKKKSGCSPLPADSPFAKTANRPLHMTNGLKDCLVACNKTEVEATGMDPCHVASLTDPKLSNSKMSCFDLGPGTAGGGGGACGYNCSLVQPSGAPCTDIETQQCGVDCDTRT